MVEGKHFNYGKREWATVTAEEGTRFFYKQMLTGDKVDNIIGLHGIGEKKSSKLLDSTPRSEWDKLIVDKYLEGFEEDGYHRAVQNSQLLWILQKGKDMPIEFT
jgi:5'-3' exonuclease